MGFQLNAAVLQKQNCVQKTGQLRLVNGIIFHCCHNGGREVLPFTALDKLEQLVDQIFHQLLHEVVSISLLPVVAARRGRYCRFQLFSFLSVWVRGQ
ncbi:hypothetical protein T03_11153 [Trichinella britovi]|uniref:Uncharacterized protein n=1 Tax=Trichinella britovi TaxID=45882 RepID=A0A0V1CHS0_TRIBR|nr:hypothetical protein T03_11153 [Trichinella britovi]